MTRTLGMSMALADLASDREEACPLEVSRLRSEQKNNQICDRHQSSDRHSWTCSVGHFFMI